MNNAFKVKTGLNVEPKTGSTVTTKGDVAYNDSTAQVEIYTTSSESVTTASNTQTVTNKSLKADSTAIVDPTDTTKKIAFTASGNTAGKTVTIAAASANNQTLTLPDATDTLTANAATQVLTNKNLGNSNNTLSGATAVTLVSGAGTLTLNTSGTATVPNATDTLVGKATTDVLTNKTVSRATNTLSGYTNNAVLIADGSGNATSEATLATTRGGTNLSSFTTGDLLYASSSSVLSKLGVGTANQVIKQVNGLPAWAAAPTGGVNYLAANPDAETDITGWTTYADAAQNTPVDATGGSPSSTWTRTTSTPLRGSGSFLWTRTANNRQGEGVAYPFTLDNADQGRVIGITFDYKVASGTFVAADGITAPLNDGTTSQNAGMSDLEVFVYDVTNSVLIPITPQVLMSTSTTDSQYKGTFQTSNNSTSYRFVIHTARSTAVAFTMQFDNFFVGPQAVAYGPPITDPVAYTPIFTGFGTTSAVNFTSWRNGSYLMVEGAFTAGTNTATEAQITLGYNGTSANVTTLSTLPTLSAVGKMNGTTASATTFGGAVVTAEASKTYMTLSIESSTVNGLSKSNGNTFTNSNTYSLSAKFPIQGWSSNVQMSNDTDTRIVSVDYTNNGGQALTANTTDITWSTKVEDTHGLWNGSVFTAQIPGDYHIAGSIRGNAAVQASYSIYKNGSQYRRIHTDEASVQTHSFVGRIKLVAGDTFSIRTDGNFTLEDASATHWITIDRVSGPATIATNERVSIDYTDNDSSSVSSSVDIKWSTKVKDTHGLWSGTVFTTQIPGDYNFSGMFNPSTSNDLNIFLYKNGSQYRRVGNITGSSIQRHPFNGRVTLVAGDTISFRPDQTVTLETSTLNHWITIGLEK